MQEFWKNKNVFLTGHTGFKGGWLALWLAELGAKVTGYGLAPNTTPSFYDKVQLKSFIHKSIIANICDYETLKRAISETQPEIIFHLAAQPLVRYSYKNTIETYQTNVMGTVHLLEIVRTTPSVKAVIVVTSDKCYENKEWDWGYRENEAMGGYDPYSSSKGCTELVTSAFRQSFFSHTKTKGHRMILSSVRAGNVIGGGDWSLDRLIPDALRAFEKNEILKIRHPQAQRPWQHVLEPLSGYLLLAQKMYTDGPTYEGAWNFGPNDKDARSVQEVLEILIRNWDKQIIENLSYLQNEKDTSGDKNLNNLKKAKWDKETEEQLHEAHFLKLDCSKAKNRLGWEPRWGLENAIEKIIEWHRADFSNQKMAEITLLQIKSYNQK